MDNPARGRELTHASEDCFFLFTEIQMIPRGDEDVVVIEYGNLFSLRIDTPREGTEAYGFSSFWANGDQLRYRYPRREPRIHIEVIQTIFHKQEKIFP